MTNNSYFHFKPFIIYVEKRNIEYLFSWKNIDLSNYSIKMFVNYSNLYKKKIEKIYNIYVSEMQYLLHCGKYYSENIIIMQV